MPTAAQYLTDLFLLPFHLTLLFALAPFRIAKWGVRTGREWTLWGFSLIPSARKYLTHKLEAQRKSSVPRQETRKPLPTVASLSKAHDEATESESKPSPSSIYDDFLSGLKHSLETVTDPQARANVMKKIVESAQATAMEATNMLGQQSKNIDEMESASEQLHQAYAAQSFKLQQSSDQYTQLEKKYQQTNATLENTKMELKKSRSKIQDLEKRYAEEKKQHENALKGDRLLLLKMEKDLIQERQKRTEIQEKMQFANLELVDLVIREEQKRRKDYVEATELKEAIAIETEIHKVLEAQAQPAEIKSESNPSESMPSEPEASHEFDPTHFSYKDAVVEHVQPVHHEFNTKVLSFKDAVLEPAYEEPLQNQDESHSQASH